MGHMVLWITVPGGLANGGRSRGLLGGPCGSCRCEPGGGRRFLSCAVPVLRRFLCIAPLSHAPDRLASRYPHRNPTQTVGSGSGRSSRPSAGPRTPSSPRCRWRTGTCTGSSRRRRRRARRQRTLRSRCAAGPSGTAHGKAAVALAWEARRSTVGYAHVLITGLPAVRFRQACCWWSPCSPASPCSPTGSGDLCVTVHVACHSDPCEPVGPAIPWEPWSRACDDPVFPVCYRMPSSPCTPPQVALFWGKARRVVATKVALQVGSGPGVQPS